MFDTALRRGAGWQAAHEDLIRLARTRAGLDFEEGEKLRGAERARVHERLGYGSFVEYIERLFGYSPRLTLEKLRVAQALDGLPQLAAALREGNVSWSSVRELTRVATPDTERDWLEASRECTMREIERLVSGHRPGDLPSDAKDWRAERHVLRFEVSAEVLASFREAQAKLRRDAGGPLDDDAALLLMARHVLGGPTDDGRASYQIALTVCEACARATQTGLGEVLQISPEVAEMASCDAQQIKRMHTESRSHHQRGDAPHGHVSGTRLRASNKKESARIGGGGEGSDETHVGRPSPGDETHVGQPFPGNETHVGQPFPGDETHVGRSFSGKRQPFAGDHSQRASQTVPPAVRRAVMLRDRHRCQVPGCRHATFVDVHHLRAREAGGGHGLDNLLTLCGAHHRACHRGDLLIVRSASGGLGFWHADGTAYGGRPNASEVDVVAKAVRGLRNLGFGERETRDAVRAARAHVGCDAGVESLLRSALERLTRKSWEKVS
jgi:hypothetical protein